MSMIRVQQPQAFDLVGNPIQVAGESLTFEATVNYRVGEGHDEVSGFFTGGGGVAFKQFQTQIQIPGNPAFKLPRLFVQLFEISAKDGSEINLVTVPVLYGPLILPGYDGYQEHRVVAGDSLSKLAARYYGDAKRWTPIYQANQHLVTDPNVIFPGQVLRIPLA
jgi:nucleoid-associated protein YgaU